MRRRAWIAAAIALGLALLAAVLVGEPGDPGLAAESEGKPRATAEAPGRAPVSAPLRRGGPSSPARVGVGTAAAPGELSEQERAERLDVARKRLERAEFTRREYEKATRYPPESRPAAEHQDQLELAAPERRMAFDKEADFDAALYLVLAQDRVFLSGDEAVTLGVRCEDRRGQPQRCEVLPGTASEADHHDQAGMLAPVPVPFAPVGEGSYQARFQPSAAGFLGASATLRIGVTARAGGATRQAFFDVLYTGTPPARFTRQVKEVADGSLHFDVGMVVRKPGRYVVTGRVDDAHGQPLAWVQFNDELPAGPQVARLTVFGKLLVDLKPPFPLTLRDVEGFLLLEEGDPDRELMTTLGGKVHTSRSHRPEAFSTAEWSSEQRTRYLDELGKDVDRARAEVDELRSP